MSLAEKQAKQKELALGLAPTIFHYKWIARGAGITDDTLKKFRDEDPEFSEQLELERTRFIDKNMKRARPEFLLESADREIFGAKAKLEIGTTNPIRMMVEKFGLDKIEGGNDDGQETDESQT